MARVLTGWTYPTAPGATAKTNNPAYYFGQMFAVEAEHDETAKTIFGNVTIPAGQTAEQDLESLLDALMAQPTMAPFICQQLIQHLVTSNPSPAYIQRVSQVFENDGTGVAGNLKAVITAILTDAEARAGDTAPSAITPNFGHLREPILLHGQSSARLERNRCARPTASPTPPPTWARSCSTRPASSATSLRSPAPKRVCSGRSSKSIRRRPPPIEPIR